MKKAVGIVSEFNPFHKGHAYLIDRVREAFPDRGIVCVMSGNFVQRGSFAIHEKYSRAKSAILGGADLVLEIPYPFSCLSAESFAGAAVKILSGIGICDTLAFGTEIGEKDALLTCAKGLSDPDFTLALKKYMKENRGKGYPTAREEVYASLFGPSPILSSPNASLAVSYLSQSIRQKAGLDFFPVQRVGNGFDSLNEEGEYLSATALRAMIEKGAPLTGKISPETEKVLEEERTAGRFPVSEEALAPVLFYLLRTKTKQEMSRIYGFSALCDRARRFLGEVRSISELAEKMKNATFTDSRIRRGLLALLLDLPRFAEKEEVLYTTVLGVGERGREMLFEIKEKGTLPIFTKPAHGLKCENEAVRRAFSRAALADEIYAMAFPAKQSEGYFLKQMPYFSHL